MPGLGDGMKKDDAVKMISDEIRRAQKDMRNEKNPEREALIRQYERGLLTAHAIMCKISSI